MVPVAQIHNIRAKAEQRRSFKLFLEESSAESAELLHTDGRRGKMLQYRTGLNKPTIWTKSSNSKPKTGIWHDSAWRIETGESSGRGCDFAISDFYCKHLPGCGHQGVDRRSAELFCVLPAGYKPQNEVTLNLRCTSGVWWRQKDGKLYITLLWKWLLVSNEWIYVKFYTPNCWNNMCSVVTFKNR